MLRMVLVYSTVLLLGCSDSSLQQGKSTLNTQDQPRADALPTLPPVSCAPDSAVRHRAKSIGALTAAETIESGRPGTPSWTPAHITDIGTWLSRYVILAPPEVWIASSTLDSFELLVPTGPGPSELNLPSATMTDERDRLWVVDGNLLKVFGVSHELDQTRRHPVIREITGSALDRDGRIHFSTPVGHEIARADTAFAVAVLSTDPTGNLGNHLVPLSQLDPPRFVTPGVTLPRVIGLGDRIGVLYPEGGVVDLFESSIRSTTIQTCMPQELADAYAEQREIVASKGLRYQTQLTLVADVRRFADTLNVLVGLPDHDDLHHVDRYLLDGSRLPSFSFRLPAAWHNKQYRFGNGNVIIAFDEVLGSVQAFSLTRI